MNTINKFNLTLFIIVSILFIVVLFLTYSKKQQPTKEEAYKKGLGYYTVEESLGCINDSLKCDEPGTETFVQYCIPHPVTGKGCVDTNGKQTYNTVIRQKPCNLLCNSHKFTVEDKIQVSNPGNQNLSYQEIIGSGCNNIIDSTTGIDYTDFFFGPYNKETNKYALKSCVPDEGYTGYYQKIFTCQKNDTKGENNCVFTCGSEGNILGLNGIFSSKLSKNLLKYFPSETDSDGRRRYVCYDINEVDQIEVLNYTNNVPKDFTYPNLCYKHVPVLNYDRLLWPNNNSENVFYFPVNSYVKDSKFYSFDYDNLKKIIGENGLVNDNYDITYDFNSYVKIYIADEIALLSKIISGGYQVNNLNYNNNSLQISEQDTKQDIIFYFVSTESVNIHSINKIETNKRSISGSLDYEFDIGKDNSNKNLPRYFYRFTHPPGKFLTTVTSGDSENLYRNQVESNFITYDKSYTGSNKYNNNTLIQFSFYPINPVLEIFDGVNLDTSPFSVKAFTLSFTSAPLPKYVATELVGKDTDISDKSEIPMFKQNTLLSFQVELQSSDGTKIINKTIFGYYVGGGINKGYGQKTESDTFTVLSRESDDWNLDPKKIKQGDPILCYYSFSINVIRSLDFIDIKATKYKITSPIYVYDSTFLIFHENNKKFSSLFPLQLYSGNFQISVNNPNGKNWMLEIYGTKTSNCICSNKNLKNSTNDVLPSSAIGKSSTLLKLSNESILNLYDSILKQNFYSLTSGNTWKYSIQDGKSGNVNIYYKRTGVYNCVIDNKIVLFTHQADNWKVTIDSEDAEFKSITSKEINFSDSKGVNYLLQAEKNMVNTTTVFYYYGTVSSVSPTPAYYYPLAIVSPGFPKEDLISFEELSNPYLITSNDLRHSVLLPPHSEEFTYLDLGLYSGSADVNYDILECNISGIPGPDSGFPIKFINKFAGNLTRRTNLGSYLSVDTLYLNNPNNIPLVNELNDDDNKPRFRMTSTFTNMSGKKHILELLRRDSLFFETNYKLMENNYREQKIQLYLEMISKQNKGFLTDTTNTLQDSINNFSIIILPQKTVTVSADYKVFKSPYTIEEDGNYNFLCYTEKGTPKAKGTRIKLGENQKMYMNKSCSDYNFETSSKCGVIGINDISANEENKIAPCKQNRITSDPNFQEECQAYTRDRYNTLNNLFEPGIIPKEMFKSKKMGDTIDSKINVFKDFFTREENPKNIYKPDEELYINKNSQNFYLSLKNDNLEFVSETTGWEKIFQYQNLTKSVVYQNHFDTVNQIGVSTPINFGLTGKLTQNQINANFGHRIVFKNTKTGLNTQNFFYSGVQFYHDITDGNDYSNFNTVIQPTNRKKYALTDFSSEYDSLYSSSVLDTSNIWFPNTMYSKMIPSNTFGVNLFDKAHPLYYKAFVSNSLNTKVRLISSLNSTKDSLDIGVSAGFVIKKESIYGLGGIISSYSSGNAYNIDNINTFRAKAVIETVTSETNKKVNRIKFTVTDNNLSSQYSDVSPGDYINIDENFFGQLFFNLLGDGSKNINVKLATYLNPPSLLDSTYTNPTYGKTKTTTINTSRVLHIYGNIQNSDTIDNITYDILNNLIPNFGDDDESTLTEARAGIKKVQLSPSNSRYKEEDIDAVVGSLEIFDILVYYRSNISENPYFCRLIKITREKIDGNNVTNLFFEPDIKATLTVSFYKIESNAIQFNRGLFFNLKKSGSVINNYYQITEVSQRELSFYFDIDGFTINNIQSSSDDTNTLYDSTYVNSNTGSGTFTTGSNIQYSHSDKKVTNGNVPVPFNTFCFFISARYIKNKVQIPFQKLNENLYLCMTRKNESEYYDTKLLSSVTEFIKLSNSTGSYYFFNEFREDYGYGNPQIERTFKIGDLIKYITKNNNTDGRYTEEEVAIFKVVDTGIEINSLFADDPTSSKPNQNTFLKTYDYQCQLTTNISGFSDISNLSKNNVTVFTDYNSPDIKPSGFVSIYKDLKNSYLDTSKTAEVPLYYPFEATDISLDSDDSYRGVSINQIPYVSFPYNGATAKTNYYRMELNCVLGNHYPVEDLKPNYDNSGLVGVRKFGINTLGLCANAASLTKTTYLKDLFLNHDYQKLIFNSSDKENTDGNNIYWGTAREAELNLNYSSSIRYPSQYIRGNRLDVLQLVETTLRSVNNKDDFVSIKINNLTGKPYGSEFVLNATNSEILDPNHNRLGNITDFTVDKYSISNSTIGDIFESDKGFQLILTEEEPSEYQFVSIEKNNKIVPFESEISQVITPYNKGNIVSFINRNERQYFRNNSDSDSYFNFELNNTNNFEIVPKTVYPQDAFIDYHPDVYFNKGDTVKFGSDTELRGLYSCQLSNYGIPITSENHNYWVYDILKENMKSNNQQFYSFNYENEKIQTGEILNNILSDTQELNNLNLPLQIKTFDSNNNEKDYCPNSCAVLNNDEKTLKQIIDESFIGQLDYFADIRYIFETPILLRQDSTKKYITLGHSPVSYNEKNDYNVTFLSSSSDTSNLVSQFLYFIDLDNDTKIYNKPKCNNNFTYYKEDGTLIDSGISSFEFSNSLIFQFVPCDLYSQDYIRFDVEDNNIVKAFNSDLNFLNTFPPKNEPIPLIHYNNTTKEFNGITSNFDTSRLLLGGNLFSENINKDIVLTNTDYSINLEIEEFGPSLEGLIDPSITNNGSNYKYGDMWHLTPYDKNKNDIGTSILTYGFVVPREEGKLHEDSFIQLKDINKNFTGNTIISINSETGSDFKTDSIVLSGGNIKKYKLKQNSDNVIPGIYSGVCVPGNGPGMSPSKKNFTEIRFDVRIDGNKILQKDEAKVTPSIDISNGDKIYFPSYNVSENIKAKALASFGSNYLGNISYNNRGFKTLENKIIPTGVFKQYTNNVFTNKISSSGATVIAKNFNLNMNKLLDVMRINFKSDKTFSLNLNNYSLPINDIKSNLIQRKGLNLGAVNSNSVNSFTVEEIKNISGVSMKLSFKEFIEFNSKYVTPSKNNKGKIPGNTNTQIKIREIRQNNSNDYIEASDNCSLYFEPLLTPTTNLDGDSIFINKNNKSNQGGTAKITVVNQNIYNSSSIQKLRFTLTFDNAIKFEPSLEQSFFIGNNLTYYFNQTDESNDNYPLVFSTSGTNFKDNIITAPEKDFEGGIIKINYFLDYQEVSQAVYVNTLENYKQLRNIRFMFQTPFSATNTNVNIYYGTPDGGLDSGGKFTIIYH